MGTSSTFEGQPGGTPLVPSWLGDDGAPSVTSDGIGSDGQLPDGAGSPLAPPISPPNTPLPPVADPSRFKAPRSNLSRFAASGGTDRRSLGRAVSRYVGSSAGGVRAAAVRMGASHRAGSRLLGFLSNAVTRGAAEALREMNLDMLAGRPIEEIFRGLVDYICPDGGSIDEGIARAAFIETIADLAEAEIADLDSMTADQMQTVFELYATNAIEARLCNDIGKKVVTLPLDTHDVARVQAELHDFIQRGVADALTIARNAAAALTPERVFGFVSDIYEQAFSILQVMGEAEVT